MTAKNKINRQSVTFHVKRGDNVIITVGDYKGITGAVTKVCRKTARVAVEGVEKIKRTPRKQANGQLSNSLELERLIHVSNVRKVKA